VVKVIIKVIDLSVKFFGFVLLSLLVQYTSHPITLCPSLTVSYIPLDHPLTG
jgi:hypothetical protein